MSGRRQDSAALEGARRATGRAADRGPRDGGRFCARGKAQAVLCLLRGESLETISRELGITASRLSAWRDRFLAGRQASLESRSGDERGEELGRLKAKVGELTMDNELFLEKIRRMEGGRP